MEILFLDDERELSDVTWIQYPANINKIHVVRNFHEFKHFCLNHNIEHIGFSLDHDLQDFHYQANLSLDDLDYAFSNKYGKQPNFVEFTGESCLKWLLNQNFAIPQHIWVHSQNLIAKQRMVNLILK